VTIILALGGVSGLLAPELQKPLRPHFSAEAEIASLGAFLLTLGGALVGAAAIVSSLVLFAVQVNVERVPHGLFRRLGADRRLLGAFAVTFILAIAIASLSLVIDQQRIGAIAFMAFWGAATILRLFLYCYRRALALVNPAQQLDMVVRQAGQDLRAWAKRAERAAPLLSDALPSPPPDPRSSRHDLARVAFFQENQ